MLVYGATKSCCLVYWCTRSLRIDGVDCDAHDNLESQGPKTPQIRKVCCKKCDFYSHFSGLAPFSRLGDPLYDLTVIPNFDVSQCWCPLPVLFAAGKLAVKFRDA